MIDYLVRTCFTQGLGLPDAIHADDQCKVAGACGLHTRDGILDDHSPGRVDLQTAGRFDKRVGCRLALQPLPDVQAIHARVKELSYAGCFENCCSIDARGHDCRRHALRP
jgi:hypothetical protein